MTFKVNNYYISDNKAKYKCIRLTTQYAFMQDVHGRVEQRKILKDGKDEEIKHPFLDEKIQWGMVPYAQALLLARYLRGDMDAYPPFLWK